jgi:hypothetical protein
MGIKNVGPLGRPPSWGINGCKIIVLSVYKNRARREMSVFAHWGYESTKKNKWYTLHYTIPFYTTTTTTTFSTTTLYQYIPFGIHRCIPIGGTYVRNN